MLQYLIWWQGKISSFDCSDITWHCKEQHISLVWMIKKIHGKSLNTSRPIYSPSPPPTTNPKKEDSQFFLVIFFIRFFQMNLNIWLQHVLISLELAQFSDTQCMWSVLNTKLHPVESLLQDQQIGPIWIYKLSPNSKDMYLAWEASSAIPLWADN